MTSHPSDSTAFHGPAAAVRTYLTADVVALVSERDVVRAVSEALDLDATPARDIGSTHLIWIEADDSIADAAEEMMEDYVRHVLVRDGGRLVGVLSMRDVVAAYIT